MQASRARLSWNTADTAVKERLVNPRCRDWIWTGSANGAWFAVVLQTSASVDHAVIAERYN